jgi:hypothetical protein
MPVFALALLLPACAVAPTRSAPPVAAYRAQDAPVHLEEISTRADGGIVCERVARPGSRLTERVCKSRQDLTVQRERAMGTLLEMVRDADLAGAAFERR